jgi:hypothetical protein
MDAKSRLDLGSSCAAFDVNALYFQVLTPVVTLNSDSGETYALPISPGPPPQSPSRVHSPFWSRPG